MIIGVSGKLGSGKDLVAAIIKKQMPTQMWEVKKYADRLKEMLATLLGCSRDLMESAEFKNTPVEWLGKTPRHLLQTLGTEWGRNEHKDIWVNALFSNYIGGDGRVEFEMEAERTVETRHTNNGPEVTTVYRVPQHALLPEDQWGLEISQSRVRVRVATGSKYPNWIITDVRFQNEIDAIKEREGIVIRIDRETPSDGPSHLSESALDTYKDWDYVITNNGTIEELEQRVSEIVEDLKRIGFVAQKGES
jgi:hypothetical protein